MASSVVNPFAKVLALPNIALPPLHSAVGTRFVDAEIAESLPPFQSAEFGNPQRYCLKAKLTHNQPLASVYDRSPKLPPICDIFKFPNSFHPLTPPFTADPRYSNESAQPPPMPKISFTPTSPPTSNLSSSDSQDSACVSPISSPPYSPSQPAEISDSSIAVPVYTRDSTEAGYMCRNCLETSITPKSKRVFRTLNSLRLHVKLHHEKGRTFTCEVDSCRKSFFRKQDLERHSATHLPEGCKPFMCNCCGTRFTRNDALRRHVKALRCVRM